MNFFKTEIGDLLCDSVAFLIASMTTGEIVYASKPLEALFGYQIKGEMVGMNVDDLVPDDKKEVHATHRANYLQDIAQCRASGIGVCVDGKKRDGTLCKVFVGLTASVIQKDKYVLAIIVPVTERSTV